MTATELAALKDVAWYRSARVMLAIVSAWGYVFFYLLRNDLSMAIVCMVRDPLEHSDAVTTEEAWVAWNRSSTQDLATASLTESRSVCDESYTRTVREKSQNTGELEWSKELRGAALSSFYLGYVFTQIPGGLLARRFGGKHVFGTGIFITALATLLVPLAARTHVYLLIALRVLMGLGCGVGFPATHHLYGQWIPPNERSKLIAFGYAGTYIGTIIAMSLSGVFCDLKIDNGWPMIFYVYGGAGVIWWIFWNLFAYNTPKDHPRIDPIEMNFIIDSVGANVFEKDLNEVTPFREMVKSKAVWAIVVAQCCNNWTQYTIMTCIPMYMNEVLKFNVKQNGALSALPYIVSYIGAVGAGQFADLLIRRQIANTTLTRKICQCSSSGIPAVLIVAMGFLSCEQRYMAVGVLCLALFFNSFCRAGYMINHVDISPKYAGVLFGMSNTVSTFPGILAPIAVGVLTPNKNQLEWRNVFYISGALYAFSTVVYAFLGDGTEQSWSKGTSAGQSNRRTPEVNVIESSEKETEVAKDVINKL